MSSTSTTVCQGLQTCLEPILLEPRVLMHQLTPSKQGLSFPYPPQKHIEITQTSLQTYPIQKIMCQNSRNNNIQESKHCWGFMKSLTNNSCIFRASKDESEQVYTHPLDKSSVSWLSSRSLEMCTESLGSETGSCIDSNISDFSQPELKKQSFSRMKPAKAPELSRNVKQSSSFPPPLTSISGSDGVHVQTHREGGRLVIKAYNNSACSSYFQAERENGRLRLSLFRHSDAEEDEEEEEEDDRDGNEETVDEHENFDDDDEEIDLNGCLWGENGGKIGIRIGGGECGGGSRCCGDGKRLPSWPYWVAIS